MEPQAPQKHVCGVCKDEWLTEDEYNGHVCPGTNHTPQQAEHLINSTQPDFADVQKAALTRGLETAEAAHNDVQVARNQEAIQQLDTSAPAAPVEPQSSPLNLG